jgi:hypothetical protein
MVASSPRADIAVLCPRQRSTRHVKRSDCAAKGSNPNLLRKQRYDEARMGTNPDEEITQAGKLLYVTYEVPAFLDLGSGSARAYGIVTAISFD